MCQWVDWKYPLFGESAFVRPGRNHWNSATSMYLTTLFEFCSSDWKQRYNLFVVKMIDDMSFTSTTFKAMHGTGEERLLLYAHSKTFNTICPGARKMGGYPSHSKTYTADDTAFSLGGMTAQHVLQCFHIHSELRF